MKKALFIDRDGTLVIEPPSDQQVDSLEKLRFYPGVFRYLSWIAESLDYELVMVSNQDGLGTASFPEDTFWPAQDKIIEAFRNEGVDFSEILIDRSRPEEGLDTRKPGIGMMAKYLQGDYDLKQSFVIGDRLTDIEFAKNLGASAILLSPVDKEADDSAGCALRTDSWKKIYEFLKYGLRKAEIKRKTNETDIHLKLNLDGSGKSDIHTGIAFFDHMLEQLSRHGMIDIDMRVKGDLEVDEHHTVEDTAIALGEAFNSALKSREGMERYGFCLPMDDCLARVAIDFGGRSWINWKVEFRREMIGKMPTEMFFHFFKSFSDGARCNLDIRADGINEHHKIEAIFKAFARAIKMAVRRDLNNMLLPSTKGLI